MAERNAGRSITFHHIHSYSVGPPRWGWTVLVRDLSQAVGLGWHRVVPSGLREGTPSYRMRLLRRVFPEPAGGRFEVLNFILQIGNLPVRPVVPQRGRRALPQPGPFG